MSGNFTKNKQKAVIAMSGGVDSSVAAALLKEQGHEVIGVTMILACTEHASDRSCCSLSAARDAALVAEKLGFPHYTLNFKGDFRRLVIENFIAEYRRGRTPNPCIRCNQFIKFDLLLKKAKELGADLIATGHYARIGKSEILNPKSETNPNYQILNYKLLKGKDRKKDQAYVLYRLDQETLVHVMFPLGERIKDEVRRIARDLKLPVADKEESQEICFVEDDNYVSFLKKEAPELVKPGEIVDLAGKVVGRHDGIAFYTIGQRKGVGAHRGEPKYVIGIDPEKNTVIIGDDKDTLKSELITEDIIFVSGEMPTGPLEITAKIRYNSPEAEAMLLPGGKVVFKKPQRAVTPGQSVVFYQGDEVIGGGIIR